MSDIGEKRGDPFEEVTDETAGARFGAGYQGDDADDISPPEMHEGELPAGFELAVDELPGAAEPDGGPDPEPVIADLGDVFEDQGGGIPEPEEDFEDPRDAPHVVDAGAQHGDDAGDHDLPDIDL